MLKKANLRAETSRQCLQSLIVIRRIHSSFQCLRPTFLALSRNLFVTWWKSLVLQIDLSCILKTADGILDSLCT